MLLLLLVVVVLSLQAQTVMRSAGCRMGVPRCQITRVTLTAWTLMVGWVAP
jgi:hypothetical protein